MITILHKLSVATADIEKGIILSVNLEGHVECSSEFRDVELMVKAINKLVESIDLKHKCNENYEVLRESFNKIIDNIGSVLKLDYFIWLDEEESNLKTVKMFIDEFEG